MPRAVAKRILRGEHHMVRLVRLRDLSESPEPQVSIAPSDIAFLLKMLAKAKLRQDHAESIIYKMRDEYDRINEYRRSKGLPPFV